MLSLLSKRLTLRSATAAGPGLVAVKAVVVLDAVDLAVGLPRGAASGLVGNAQVVSVPVVSVLAGAAQASVTPAVVGGIRPAS